MAATHVSWSRAPHDLNHVLPRGLALAFAGTAVARLGYLMGRVVSDVQRIEANRRS